MKHFYAVTVAFAILWASGCKVIDPSEEIPAWISVDTMAVEIQDPVNQGTASHKLTDAWVYINNDLLGIFEVPFTIPVIASGNTGIKIRGGIKLNGISSTRVAYPFFDFYETAVPITPMDTLKINPVVSYYSGTSFAFLEDFESGSSVERMNTSDTSIEIIHDPAFAFEGDRAAAIFLDSDRGFYKGRSKGVNPITLPAGSPNVFVELNYKSNQNFYINFGAVFQTQTVEIPVLRVNPQDNWNKIYVNFSPYVRDYPNALDYYFVITASKDPLVAQPAIYLDNLKLVYSE